MRQVSSGGVRHGTCAYKPSWPSGSRLSTPLVARSAIRASIISLRELPSSSSWARCTSKNDWPTRLQTNSPLGPPTRSHLRWACSSNACPAQNNGERRARMSGKRRVGCARGKGAHRISIDKSRWGAAPVRTRLHWRDAPVPTQTDVKCMYIHARARAHALAPAHAFACADMRVFACTLMYNMPIFMHVHVHSYFAIDVEKPRLRKNLQPEPIRQVRQRGQLGVRDAQSARRKCGARARTIRRCRNETHATVVVVYSAH